MLSFDINNYSSYSELPLQEFKKARFSIYVMDKEWNYLFANEFSAQNQAKDASFFFGKNIWTLFPELARDLAFIQLKQNCEHGLETHLTTTSPLNGQRLKIASRPLKDCYLFFSSVMPSKDDLLNGLKNELRNRLEHLYQDFAVLQTTKENRRPTGQRRFYDIYVN